MDKRYIGEQVMIKDISNITNKSFDHFSSDDEFGLINIIFGVNGSGKSALTQWLKNNVPEKNRVFDTNYVRNNILAQNEIMGVKLTVGQTALNLEENINCIKNVNENIQSLIGKRNDNKKNIENQLFQILNTTLNQAKDQFDLTKNINQKPNAKQNPLTAYNQWLKDIDKSLPVSGSSKELEQKKSLLKEKYKNINTIFNMDESRLKKFRDRMLIPTMEPSNKISQQIVGWITEGISMHNMKNEHEVCQFCGHSFNGPELYEVILNKTDNEYAKLTKALITLKDDLLKSKEKLLDLPNDIETEEILNIVFKITKHIEEKIVNTNHVIDVDENLLTKLVEFDQRLEAKKKSLEKDISDINQQIHETERIAKSWIGLQLKDNSAIQSLSSKLTKETEQIAILDDVLKDNNIWIGEQQRTNSDLKPFRDLVNHEFEIIGLDFKLEIMSDNQHYLIKHKNFDIKISTKDLSEGERRLLGFLHFYYDLFDKPNGAIINDVDLILIDDPITSLDIDNRYYLTELINDFIKKSLKSNKQLFVLTHSSLDFHNFGYAHRNGITFWKIKKNIESHSEIVKQNAKDVQNYSDYYQTIFREVYDFAALGRTKLPESNFISFGNKTRLILESHARTHYRLEYATQGAYSELKKYYEVDDKHDEELKKSLDIINSLSHGMTFADTHIISVREVQKSVRCILSMLYKKDQFHLSQMAGDAYNVRDQTAWLNSMA